MAILLDIIVDYHRIESQRQFMIPSLVLHMGELGRTQWQGED
jgi:hypothetical protein